MKSNLSRREFLAAGAATVAAGTLAREAGLFAGVVRPSDQPTSRMNDSDIPLVDFHCHRDGLGLEKMLVIAKEKGMKFGIVEHAGTKANKYPVLLSNDDELKAYIASLEGKGVYKGVQAECVDWMTCFSKDVVAQLDYVLTDAMTFIEKDGTRVNLWKKEQVKIDDKQDFMDRYVDFNVRVLSQEPIDILANPTYLPEVIVADFDELWTEKRMKKVIEAAVDCNVAIEISSSYCLPKPVFLKMAKKAGAKFSFGSNIRGPNIGKLVYCLEMVREIGLKGDDIFNPAPPGKKPIQIRKFS